MTPETDFHFEFVAARPACPNGYEYVSASVSTQGEAIFVFTEKPQAKGVLGKTKNSSGAVFPNTKIGAEVAFKLVILSLQGNAIEIDLPPLDITFPICDLFCDQRILLAGARSRWRAADDFDKNGVIFDPATGQTSRILLGDGIADLCIDEENRIWVSYFDEGVYGNLGWSRPGPTGPGAGGLVCFAEDGALLWAFNGPENASFIDDCYALNAQRHQRWAYYYSDFNLCAVGRDFRPTVYSGVPVSGSSAFAVLDAGFLFTNQYRETSDTFHFVSKNGQELTHARTIRGRLPQRDWIEKCLLVGRGPWMHVINEKGWFAADVSRHLG